MKFHYAQYDDESTWYVVNLADVDVSLNSVADAPAVLQEIRRATVESLLNVARAQGEAVLKVTPQGPPRDAVRGYVTFLRCVRGCEPAHLERRLGFRSGALAQGAMLYVIDQSALNRDNVVPRGSTDWSAGASPRDLHNLSQRSGVAVGYHPDYPAADDPIIQFFITEPVPYVGSPRFVQSGEVV